MANYSDQYYSDVDKAFDSLRPNVFQETLSDPTPQDSYTLPLGPVGWVENADATDGEAKVIINADGITVIDGKINVVNGATTVIEDGVVREVENVGADVTIDENGITILNGAISIADAGGSSVLTAAGFAGSWIDFLELGTYNGAFSAGTTNSITAVTKVGTASTLADYNASISDDIPYWVIDAVNVAGGGTMARFADSDASAGWCVRFNGNVSGRIFQDVPVVPGAVCNLDAVMRLAAGTPPWEIQFNVHYQWRAADHSAIGVRASDGIVIINGGTTDYFRGELAVDVLDSIGVAPANARFLRAEFEIIRNSGSPDVRFSDLIVKDIGSYAALQGLNASAGIRLRSSTSQTEDKFYLSADGVMGWSDGTNPADVILSRASADVLQLHADNLKFNGGDIEFSAFGNASDVFISRIGANRIALESGDAFDGYLRFVPVNRVTVLNASTAVSIARGLTGAIAGIPVDARLLVGYLDIDANVAPNSNNWIAVFQSQSGTSDFASIARQVGTSGVLNTVPFIAPVIESSGRKLSYQVSRNAGTINYSLFVTGYYTDLVT